MQKFLQKLDKAIFALLVVWCFFAFFFKVNALNNLSSILLGLGLLLYICLDFKTAKETFLANLKSNLVLLIFLAVLLLGAIIISLNSYFDSSKEFSKLIRREILFLILLMFLSWFGKKGLDTQKIIKFCFYAIIASFAINLIYFFLQDIVAIDTLHRRKHNSPSIIDRYFGKVFDIFFPFVLTAFFIAKEKYKKIFFATMLCIGLVFLILSGMRGAILAFGVTIFFMIVCLAFKNNFDKKKLVYIISFMILGTLSFAIVVHQNQYLQKKYLHTTHSSGRNIIIKERFPLLLESKYALRGLGAGDTQYQMFLNNQPAEIQKKLGPRKESEQQELYKIGFFHDEPALLGIYWHYGILGTLGLFSAICLIFFSSIKGFYRENNYYLFAFASSIFSYYFVAGLFENYSDFKVLLSFCMLFLVFKFAKSSV